MNANEILDILLSKADDPSRIIYVLTVADILEVVAENFEDKVDPSTLTIAEVEEIILDAEKLLNTQDEYPGYSVFDCAAKDWLYEKGIK